MGTTRVTRTTHRTSEELQRETQVTREHDAGGPGRGCAPDDVGEFAADLHASRQAAHAGGPGRGCTLDAEAFSADLHAGKQALCEDDPDEELRAREEAERADSRCGAAPGPGEPDELPEDEHDVMRMDAKTLGRKGEDCAVRYLTLQGYDILERNWTCRFGEADIIALDPDGTLCLVEVKTRRSVEAGVPEAAVTPEKQRKYERIALTYLMDADFGDGLPVRFDCIGICVTRNSRAMLRHHKGCFDGLF